MTSLTAWSLAATICSDREPMTIAIRKRFVPFGKAIDSHTRFVVSRLTKTATLYVGQEHRTIFRGQRPAPKQVCWVLPCKL